jgi:hypothetical protein
MGAISDLFTLAAGQGTVNSDKDFSEQGLDVKDLGPVSGAVKVV